jgi:hypothetical protein
VFGRRQLIEGAVTNVVVERDEGDDGRLVEVITLVFEGEGAVEFINGLGSGNETKLSVFARASKGMVTVSIAIDENDILIGRFVVMSMTIEDINLGVF